MIDIKQDADGDIDLTTGDIVMGEPTEQHKRDILLSSQGDIAEAPLTGVGLVDYINANNNGMILRDINRQMQKDGIKVISVGFDVDGDLLIDGRYEDDSN